MTDVQNRIRELLMVIKPEILRVGFGKLRVKDVMACSGLSKNTFFNYFGSMTNLLELVLLDELTHLYDSIILSLKNEDRINIDESIINTMKMELVHAENGVLHLYFASQDCFTARLDNLRQRFKKMDKEFLVNTILVYREQQSPFLL